MDKTSLTVNQTDNFFIFLIVSIFLCFGSLISLSFASLEGVGDIVNIHRMFGLVCRESINEYRDFEIALFTLANNGLLCGLEVVKFQKILIGFNVILFFGAIVMFGFSYGSIAGLSALFCFLITSDFWLIGHFFRQFASLSLVIYSLLARKSNFSRVGFLALACSFHVPTALLGLVVLVLRDSPWRLILVGTLFLLAIAFFWYEDIYLFLIKNYGTVRLQRGTPFQDSSSVAALRLICVTIIFSLFVWWRGGGTLLLGCSLSYLAIFTGFWVGNLPDELFVRIYLYFKYIIFMYAFGICGKMLFCSGPSKHLGVLR